MRYYKIVIMVIFICALSTNSYAICAGVISNPISDVCWSCIFPIKIAGVPIGSSPRITTDGPDSLSSPVCICPAPPPRFFRIGLTISYYEPSRIVEVVKDPYCFPSLGMGSSNPFQGMGGSQAEIATGDVSSFFAQAHYYIYPVWAIMELFTDWICQDSGSSLDLAYMTEVDPLWNDDSMSAIIHPEVLLFANPIAQAACMVDAATCMYGKPLNSLFWCMGTYGSAYPMTGHVQTDKIVQGAAAAAGRMTYKLAREFLLWDPAVNPCSSTPTPIWIKWHYRYQIVRPIIGRTCWPIGQTSLLWGNLKNPPAGGFSASDNFMFLVFKKRLCCASS